MSYYDEPDETEDEEDERIYYRKKPQNSLLSAKQCVRTFISDRKEEATGGKVKLTEEDVDQIFEKFPAITQEGFGKTPTMLHAIFDMVHSDEEENIDSVTVKLLVQRLVQQAAHLLCVTNEENQNPLYLAIVKKKRILADYMVAFSFPPEDPNRQHLVKSLEDCRGNEQGKNCLHLAFEKDLKLTTLERMVRFASDKALKAVDITGRRAMHYAVQYKNCNVEVIRAFLEKDNEARSLENPPSQNQSTSTFLDVDEKAMTSVFQEHVSSALAHEEEHSLRQETAHHKDRPENSKERENDIWGRWDEMAVGRGTALQPMSETELQSELGSKSPLYPGQRYPAALGELGRAHDPVGDRLGPQRGDEIMDKEMISLQNARERGRQSEADSRHEAEAQDENGQNSRSRQDLNPPGGRSATHIQTTSSSTAVTKTGGGITANTPKPLKRVPTMVDKNTRSKPETKLKRVNTFRRGNTVRKPRKPIDHEAAARASKTVLRMLKLHYMRTRSIEKATWWLYETNPQDVQTFFDYRRLPSEIKEKLFKDAFAGTKFDEVLSSVHFPNVTVIWGKKANPSKQRPIGGSGRQDMRLFFDFLYDKGVRHILKVVVEEGGHPVHSDEVIKNALSRITVEHLDWQKIDMDPELICGISSQADDMLVKHEGDISSTNQIRQLDLQWSGNNAALRAWSEPEGLPLLPHLKIVNIIVPKAVVLCDSDELILRRKKEFEERLNKNRMAIGHQQGIDQSSPSPGKHEVAVNLSCPNSDIEKKAAHEWLKCMDDFARNINMIWESTRDGYSNSIGGTSLVSGHETTPKPAVGAGLKDEVIVALIDDGVSLLDQNLAGRVLEGKTFDYGDGGIIGQSYSSAQGHGTEMARCILRVCPMAKIYPIRLKTHIVNGKSQIVLKSAALAINAGLEKNATIISMSWTIPVPDHPSPEKTLFEDAVRKAISRNVLMFCSSPDMGKYKNANYPSAVQRDKVFRIGAAHDYGSAFEHTDKSVDFIFPGVQVNTNATSPATGSSIATALAAGLAATIIYCFKISALAVKTHSQARSSGEISPPTFTASALRRLSEHEVMKAAFKNIGWVNDDKFI